MPFTRALLASFNSTAPSTISIVPTIPLDCVGGFGVAEVAAACRFDRIQSGEQHQHHAQSGALDLDQCGLK